MSVMKFYIFITKGLSKHSYSVLCFILIQVITFFNDYNVQIMVPFSPCTLMQMPSSVEVYSAPSTLLTALTTEW